VSLGNRWFWLLACLVLPAAAQAQPAPEPPGLYMTRLSDCMPCHTKPGGTPFAGGREIGTPFGSLVSPNITPDRDTGIGGWSDDDFYRALHDGLGHQGEYLYPVMPYTSYTRMTREDVLAIKAYLDTLKPVYAPRGPNALAFPFDIRATLFVWRELFFRPGTFTPNAAHSAEWNRGAYIVQGPGHCGECHSPRNIMGATESGESLSGGDVQQWLAPNISSDPLDGIGAKSVDEIVAFLKTGANKAMGVAFGPMAEVVHNSLRYATESDLHAVAVFLKEGPDREVPLAGSVATPVQLAHGQKVYLSNCAECHQDNGRGIFGAVPNLASNAAITAEQPRDLIVAVLQGLQGTGGYGRMPSFAGALSDRDVTDVVNYVRTAWRNKAPANATPDMVASLRAVANVGAAGTEAARGFDCPEVGSGTIAGAVATPAEADFLAADDGAFVRQRVQELLDRLRQQQPGITDAALTNTLNGAFCPAIANRADLTNSQKRALLARLNAAVQEQIASAAPVERRVIATVPLKPAVATALDNAAAAQHLTPQAYIATLLSKSAGAGAPAK
jgi:mono/diheme cytochrome c family protein